MAWTVVGTLREWAAEKPDAPMLIGTDGGGGPLVRTWAETHERTSRLANALFAAGVGAGDRVAFIDKNGFEYFDVLFAGGKINAVNVSVNWRLAPPEMAQIINDSGARILFVGRDFVGHLDEFEPTLTSVTRIVILDAPHNDHEDLAAFIGHHPADDPGVVPSGSDVAVQLYTSGTTGLPKGVMLSHDNFSTLLPVINEDLAMSDTSVNMVAMPLFHVGGSGWALVGVHLGAVSVVVRDLDPAAVIQAIETHQVTHAFLVPAVLQFMLLVPDVAERDLSSLVAIAYGASPISEEVLRRCIEVFGCGFVQLYGMTETTGAITVLRREDHDPGGPHPERLRSCGRPYAHVELRIVEPESGVDRAAGEVGELWIRSAQNMLGYWGKPDETARTIDAEGWLRTGDAGYLDADGYVYLHDRIKDMIVSGAENVYPAEVENVLMSHPDVADVAVIGVPSDRWGETVKAIVVPASGHSIDPTAVIAYCRERLAGFKCPTSVDTIEALPRNPSGKILKRDLRAPYWEGRERKIG